jgi:adenylate cyclase
MATQLSHPAKICIGCWQHLRLPVPLRGVASLPFRLFGIRPSRMNPNTCTICELMFSRIMKARKLTIDATILFADLRGYTALSQSQSPEAVSLLLDAFYDDCAGTIWDGDGLLIKTMGDSVMAIFNFPILREDHARRAVLTAREIRRRWTETRQTFTADNVSYAQSTGIGIGLACGQISFGEFGHSPALDAIGNVVNTASRAQSVAAADEILLTQSVYERVPEELAGSRAKEYHLKGFAAPTLLYAA